jgi:hypothetical protein
MFYASQVDDLAAVVNKRSLNTSPKIEIASSKINKVDASL